MMIPSCTFSPLEVIPPSSVQASSGQFRGPAVQLHHGTACSVAAGGSNMAFQVATQLGSPGVLGVGKFLDLGVGGVTLPPITMVVATQIFVIFAPNPGEIIQFDSYFSDGLKPPTR